MLHLQRSSLLCLLVLLTSWSPLSSLSTAPAGADPAPQEQRDAIVPIVVKTLGYPDASVAVQPYIKRITLQGDYGLADWERGEAAGMVALISHRQNTWTAIRLGGGMPSATDLSQATGMPVALAQSLLDEHVGTAQSQAQVVPNYCGSGETTFLAVETTSYLVSICGANQPTTYVGVEKRNPQQSVRIPLQDYSLTAPQYVAVNGAYTYIVGNSAKGKTLTVSKGTTELLREPIVAGL